MELNGVNPFSLNSACYKYFSLNKQINSGKTELHQLHVQSAEGSHMTFHNNTMP